ncbi:YitT family protein [Sebaldella sp. S0638]|uniref:YczE/YyaS/YitT family protein n=1 Tax=Sebaldella sp. S0638 TaxID=2957809 RepID=UPI0020A17A27|nr:hypothetical protein [Sebaldella sp. S0638]MCP1226585.1 hypothetical protein [Sebaldella sp. S0638]
MEIKNILISLLFYLLSAFGISLTIKSNIGVSSFNSFNVALSNITSIKVGTITTIINLVFLIFCVLLNPENRIKNYLLMFIALVFFGVIINIFLYTLFESIIFKNYFLRIITFIVGTFFAGMGTGKILKLGIFKFPIEYFCILLSDKTSKPFKFYRYSIDITCVLISIFISLNFKLPVFVREGTIISLLMLSGIISWSKNQ